LCDDTVDNDGDGASDCADSDCAEQLHCIESECGDSEDNDADGAVDCEDSDCLVGPPCTFSCGPSGDGSYDFHLVELSEPVLSWPWPQTGTPTFYVDDYLDFIVKAGAYANPISPQDLNDQLQAILDNEVPIQPTWSGDWNGDGVVDYPPTAEELADIIINGANLGFLLDGLAQRELKVGGVQVSSGDTFETADGEVYPGHEIILALEDPYVGVFPLFLHLPVGDGPFPVVQALPGHFETAEGFRDLHNGAGYPAEGFAIATHSPRAYDGYTAEDLVTRTMLLNGFTMVAIRIYEALLVRKLLHCRPDIDPTRMGLIGHSGGSGTANLVVRIESSYQALVTDRINQYWNWVDGILQDETALELYPWNSVINDFTTVEDTDVLETWYGYQVPLVDSEGSPMVDAGDYVYDEIFSYFGYHLGVPASP